jgi:MYXO-CTERM domain-containing protein
MVRSVLALFGCLAFVGCGSGQTGSPECGGEGRSCLCDPLQPGILHLLLRVRADRVGPDQLQATIVSVVTPAEYAPGFVAGERVGGSVLTERPCAAWEASALTAGGELLVVYQPRGNDFPPFCGDAATTQCQQQRSEALLDGSFWWAVPWTEPLSFGGGYQLSSSELSVLLGQQSCLQRFPVAPAGPCDDTPQCSVRTAPKAASWAWGFVLAAAALLVSARRVRRRDSRR